MFLMTFLLTTGDVYAENHLRPLRPTTHPGDPNLSTGTIENFRKLFLEKEDIIALLEPVSGQRGDADTPQGTTLPIINRTTAWVDIEIGGKKIGRIGPLTTGLIHDVESGSYDVTFHVEHVQYSYTERIKTISINTSVTPGNMAAQIAASPDYVKPGFDDLEQPKGGNLQIYMLQTPEASTPSDETSNEASETTPQSNTPQ